MRHSLRNDLAVRHGGLRKTIPHTQELKLHRNCTECPIPPEGLRQLVKASQYHGFGCIGAKDRGGGQPGALIEWNARIGESHVHPILVSSLLDMMKQLVARARTDHGKAWHEHHGTHQHHRPTVPTEYLGLFS